MQLQTKQKGFFLLLVLLFLILGTASFFVGTTDPQIVEIERQQKTYKALAIAKQALLGYSSTRLNDGSVRPGELPCPDIDYDGSSDLANCNGINLRGWFPWRTLRLEELRDGAGERLWYAVSDNFRNNGSVAPLNSSSLGQTRVNGIDNVFAAVVIAPGKILPGQVRNNTDPLNLAVVASYLESRNGDNNTTTYVTTGGNNFNDVVLPITAVELISQAQKIAMAEAVNALRGYYTANQFYPYAEDADDGECDANSVADAFRIGFLPTENTAGTCAYDLVNTLPAWFIDNLWDDYILFAIAPDCVFGTIGCPAGGGGMLTLGANNNVQALVISSGIPLPVVMNSCGPVPPFYDQTARANPPFNICEYLDFVMNTDGDNVFIQTPLAAGSNDLFTVVN